MTYDFPDPDEMFKQMFTYVPRTDTQMQASNVDEIIEWAEAISAEWNGDEAGSQEERAHLANDIIEKLNEAKALLAEMGEL